MGMKRINTWFSILTYGSHSSATTSTSTAMWRISSTWSIFFYTINRRSNLIFNATGKDIKNTAGRVISRLREANYKVYICVVLANFSVVMQRIADRKRKTGRDVPEAVVTSIFKGLQEAVPLYMKNQPKMADAVLVYSNNGDGTDSRSGPCF